MAQTINTNIPSLTAQRNLNSTQNALSTALERLSSGLRINSAKDDAAGLAISDRFSTQIRGLNQAIRNANDGISLSQTGEGALAEVSSNLQRIRELAVQSANATNSDSDRAALDLEVQQRLAEIDRIASQTSFNGRKILDGSFGNATFQVGAEAGQTISLNLESSTRLSQVGDIASATSSVLGADATGGSVETGTVSNFDFSASGTADGGVTVTASTLNYGTAADAGSGGQLDVANIATTAYNTAGTVAGLNVQTGIADGADLSGANLAQFDITDGTDTIGITLNANYADGAAIATAIQSQLQAVTGTFGENATVSFSGGELTITNTGNTEALEVLATDANAQTLVGLSNDTGLAGGANNAANFEVDGHAVVLDADYTDLDGVAAEIQSDLNTAAGAGAYTVSNNAGTLEIVNNTVGSTAPTIVATNAAAYGQGWDDAANLTSTDGTPAVSTTNAEFVVDGSHTITLDQDFADFDALATEIGTQLETASPGTYTVTNDGNSISIVNNDGTSTVAITTPDNGLLDDNADAAGFGDQTGAFTGEATFEVDGQSVTLNTDTTDVSGLVSAIQSQLTGYTVAANDAGDGIKITNDTLGSEAVSITSLNQNALDAGFDDLTTADGVAGGSISLASGDFSIAVGDGEAYDFAGEYANSQELAEAINRELSGVSAEITSDGELRLLSTEQINISGAEAGTGGTFGFSELTVTADAGSLSNANVTTVEDSNETIVRIDSALTEVSNLRSTFGAIQNRFESTISNLTVTSENLTASRSRIMDADFAQETANLTRAQILQQAGTAMLAQANQIPQNVLSLLG